LTENILVDSTKVPVKVDATAADDPNISVEADSTTFPIGE